MIETLAILEAAIIVALVLRILRLQSHLAVLRKVSGKLTLETFEARGFKRAHNDDFDPLGEVVIPPFLGSERR